MTQHDEMFEEIYRYVEALPVFSDHEHHAPDSFFSGRVGLDELLNSSYVAWTGYRLDGTDAARRALLDNARFNSYFTWFEKGVGRMHGLDEPISMENWQVVSRRIEKAYAADKDYHWRSLLDNGYEKLLQDAFWNPGDDNGHPQVFVPSFRIDKFMYGTHAESMAPDNINPWKQYGFSGGTLDDFVECMLAEIRSRVRAGRAVALKCAEAYNRTVAFQPDDREAAHAAFGTPAQKLEHEKLVHFGNYIFNRCCEAAAELNIPFQVHTGLAMLSGSEPMNFEPTIRRHPRTRFVLFHAGFPWTHQVAGLAHNYANVCPSLTWTATICTSAAVRALHDFIDVACSVNTITWGSDCRAAEESVGAMLAWRWIVSAVLTERLADGRQTLPQVQCLARKLMFRKRQERLPMRRKMTKSERRRAKRRGNSEERNSEEKKRRKGKTGTDSDFGRLKSVSVPAFPCWRQLEMTELQAKYTKVNFITRRLLDGFFAEVEKLARSVQAESALEVGCAEGVSTRRIRAMLPASTTLEAGDINLGWIEDAKKNNPGVPIRYESIYELPRADHSVDLVLCLEVLEHLEHPEKGLAELARVSRKWLLLSVPQGRSRILNLARFKYVRTLGNIPGHLQHWSQRGFVSLVNKYAQVLEVRTPLPWTMVLAKVR